MEYFERLREQREDHDITQKEAAYEINVNQSYYSKQERGEKPFKVEQIQKLCKMYNVSADYILGLPKGLAWPREPKEEKR